MVFILYLYKNRASFLHGYSKIAWSLLLPLSSAFQNIYIVVDDNPHENTLKMRAREI